MKKYIKIILTLLVSLTISVVSQNRVFISNTPKINRTYISQIPILTASQFRSIRNQIAQLFHFNNVANKTSPVDLPMGVNQTSGILKAIVENVSLKTLSKGVQAGKYQETQVYVFNENEIEWINHTFTLKDGRVIKIQVPKGQNPPSQQDVESSH